MIDDLETAYYGMWIIRYYSALPATPTTLDSCAYFEVRHPCDGLLIDTVEYTDLNPIFESETLSYAEISDPTRLPLTYNLEDYFQV